MRFALCALLLPALAAQGEDAEKLFRQAEQKVAKAKSLRVVADIDFRGKGKEAKLQLTVTLAEGNKARMTLKGNANGRDLDVAVVSDGKNLRFTEVASGKGKDQPTPGPFTQQIAAVVARVGPVAAFRTSEKAGKLDKDLDVEKLLPLEDFKLGKAERVNGRDAKVITYTAKIREPRAEEVRVTLWLDAKTLLPIKRQLVIENGQGHVTETYKEFTLNPKINAKTFELGS